VPGNIQAHDFFLLLMKRHFSISQRTLEHIQVSFTLKPVFPKPKVIQIEESQKDQFFEPTNSISQVISKL